MKWVVCREASPLCRITLSASQTLHCCLLRRMMTDGVVSAWLDARWHLFRVCFSEFATCVVDYSVQLYVAKADIRAESRFGRTSPAFDAAIMGVYIGISLSHLA